jgi:hypothetical protein
MLFFVRLLTLTETAKTLILVKSGAAAVVLAESITVMLLSTLVPAIVIICLIQFLVI